MMIGWFNAILFLLTQIRTFRTFEWSLTSIVYIGKSPICLLKLQSYLFQMDSGIDEGDDGH